MASFDNKKSLRFVITLGESKFGSSEYDTITLEGFRSSIEIDRAGGVQLSTLKAKIFGVSQDDMNAITTLQWKPLERIKNKVKVFAIDGDTETFVFGGDIINAWGDYQSIPDVFLYIQASSVFYAQLDKAEPISFKGAVDVAMLMEKLAGKMGLSFENNGVSVMLSDVYVAGTKADQVKELAKAANIDFYIEDDVLAIAPRNVPRSGVIPVLSKDSGMIGYPTFDAYGVIFRTLYNPSIRHGGSVKIESEISQAAGEWHVASVAHSLESEKPGGMWQSIVRGNLHAYGIKKP